VATGQTSRRGAVDAATARPEGNPTLYTPWCSATSISCSCMPGLRCPDEPYWDRAAACARCPYARDRRLTITRLDDGRSDQLIYRVVGESTEWVWSEESGAMEVSLSPGRLMGAFNAGLADQAWGDLPMPMLSNPRVRFWFTERGWRAYGLRVAAGARASGRTFRVIRRKNPSRSIVVYRDDWQVALLPDRE
jgi:hypothetical protein